MEREERGGEEDKKIPEGIPTKYTKCL